MAANLFKPTTGATAGKPTDQAKLVANDPFSVEPTKESPNLTPYDSDDISAETSLHRLESITQQVQRETAWYQLQAARYQAMLARSQSTHTTVTNANDQSAPAAPLAPLFSTEEPQEPTNTA
ncbi:hypothetical protein RSAG8_13580, partial [Rhizoctonia solani AG-8 WAC10335]